MLLTCLLLLCQKFYLLMTVYGVVGFWRKHDEDVMMKVNACPELCAF